MSNAQVPAKPFRYYDDADAVKSCGRSELVSLRVDHGVLVATILANSLVHEKVLRDIEDQIRKHLPEAKKGLLLDCSRVTLSVSSQFLGTMMQFRKVLKPLGSELAVCGLTGSFAEAFDVANFGSVVRRFETPKQAVLELGHFNEWEQARNESVQQYESALRPSEKWYACFRQARASQRSLLAGSLALAILAVGFIVILRLSSSDSAAAVADSIWAAAPRVSAEGELLYVARGVTLQDQGSAVVAWPAAGGSSSKHLIDVSSVPVGNSTAISPRGPFVARTSVDGRFRLNLPVPEGARDYYFLFVSENARSREPMLEADRTLLELYFRNPEQLIGDKQYHIFRRSIAAGNADALDWKFN